MRRRAVLGNWKMHKTPTEAGELAAEIVRRLGREPRSAEVGIFPPFPALESVGRALREAEGGIGLGAQDLFWEEWGAYTGEVSGPMLADLGCRYVIVGHSERRQYFGETDEAVGRKVAAALQAGLTAVLCVGETLAERDAGRVEEVVGRQVRKGLALAYGGRQGSAGPPAVLVAYEPVWAIGTGRNASAEEAGRVISLIRREAAAFFGPEGARSLRVLYGGSVKPENIEEFARHPEIDGALVGGASLDAEAFVTIVRHTERGAEG